MKQITRKIEQVGEVKQVTEVESVFENIEEYFNYVTFHQFLNSGVELDMGLNDEEIIH